MFFHFFLQGLELHFQFCQYLTGRVCFSILSQFLEKIDRVIGPFGAKIPTEPFKL